MMKLFPDFYVHTGDIEYYDKPLPWAMTEGMMRFKWDRLFALPLQRNFWSQVTTYFMKDDHDALRNDSWPGKKYGPVNWERGLEIFDKEQFPSHDKFYKTIRWGKDLQIWITEGRNYRSHNDMPDGKGKSIFGPVQKAWLYKTLQESDATFSDARMWVPKCLLRLSSRAAVLAQSPRILKPIRPPPPVCPR